MSAAGDQLRGFITAKRKKHGVFSWEGQRWEYDQLGPGKGIVYHRWQDENPKSSSEGMWVDCLLYYDAKGHLAGILNHYPYGAIDRDTGHMTERVGNVNVFVRPGKTEDEARQALLAECKSRWNRTETAWEPLPTTTLDGQHRLGGRR
jgi:hypothetical protein